MWLMSGARAKMTYVYVYLSKLDALVVRVCWLSWALLPKPWSPLLAAAVGANCPAQVGGKCYCTL